MLLDVVIVGGGIAGLADRLRAVAPRRLRPRARSASRPGGVILSEQVDGFTIDAGPDSLLVQKPDGDRAVPGARPRRSARPDQAAAARFHPARRPPAPAAGGVGPRHPDAHSVRSSRTRLFSWPGKLRMGAELFVPARRDEGDESIGAFMTRRFGREATDYLAEPLLAGIHAGDVDRLSLASAVPALRRQAEREHGSLLRAFRSRANRAGQQPTGRFNRCPAD